MKQAHASTAEHSGEERQEAVLCGIVLTDGQGRHLRAITQPHNDSRLHEQLPKADTAIEQTLRRAERLIPPDRVFTVVDRRNLEVPGVGAQLTGRPPGTVIVQPQHKDTGPAVLLPLAHIDKRYPGATVAVFPAHRYVRDEDTLMRHVRLAHVIVRRQPSQVVLVGITPEHEEPDYGYILPRPLQDTSGWGIFNVGEFVEKPRTTHARRLIARGALWNTMMMVFNASALFEWIHELDPELHGRFERIRAGIGDALEIPALRQEYDGLAPVNFCNGILRPLARRPGRVIVLPVSPIGWSDLGTKRHALQSLARTGRPAATPPRTSGSQREAKNGAPATAHGLRH